MPVFGEVLRAVRHELGLSQTVFGKKIGYSRTMVGKWEGLKYDSPPSRHVIEEWEKKFELSPGQLDRLLVAAGYQPRYGSSGEREAAAQIDVAELRAGKLIVVQTEDAQQLHDSRIVNFLLDNIWEVPNLSNPGTLLDARYQVVPFYEEVRRAELADLEAWCADGAATSVRLFTGAGGSGKTRLFIEWCRRLRKRGWSAGFLPDRIDDTQIETLLSVRGSTLAVVDYAESRPKLIDFLKRVAGRPITGVASLRVVLLAREVANWWRSLHELDADVHHLLLQQEPRRLASVSLEGELRGQIFGHSAGVFARCLGKPAPPAPPDGSLKDTRFGRPLYLHMAALAAVEGLPVTADSLVGEIVCHEQRFWSRRYRELHPGDALDQAEFVAGCRRLVAAVTLRGGCTTREVAEALQQRIGPTSDRHLAPFLCSLYPGRDAEGDGRYLNGLEPDLLGESLVSSVLTDANTPGAYLDRVFDDADNTSLQNGFTVLGRIALAGEPNASTWLERLLSTDVVGRAIPAFHAAMTLGELGSHAPLGRILADAMERDGTPSIASEIDRLLPEQTVSLREVAVWSSQALLNALPADPTDMQIAAERARLLNNLGIGLSELGRREAALAAAEEAVRIRRVLAGERPDAFLPDLALSLNNLGNRLSELGRREAALAAAEEAVRIRRVLAGERPDAFLPDLAMSLNNLGAMLSELGRREAALAAAEEAVRIRHVLAGARPDAFLPDLAMSLNNLGGRLSELGRREAALAAAEEAVGFYRELAGARPDAFLPDLALSLNNLGAMLSELGRREAALAAAEEAVRIRRVLAGERPDAFLPYLARSLGGYGMRLKEDDRPQDALAAFAEGIRSLTPGFMATPEAFRGLMRFLVRKYSESASELNEGLDQNLLNPIKAKLEEQNAQNDP